MRFTVDFTHAATLALALAWMAPVRGGEPSPAIRATPVLRTATTWDGTPIAYSASEHPEIQSVVVELAPGATTGWHQHLVNNIAYLLQGTLRLELEDGRTREFKAGEAFAEVVKTWHRGTNIGKDPVKILVVYVGEAGVPLAIPKKGGQ